MKNTKRPHRPPVRNGRKTTSRKLRPHKRRVRKLSYFRLCIFIILLSAICCGLWYGGVFAYRYLTKEYANFHRSTANAPAPTKNIPPPVTIKDDDNIANILFIGIKKLNNENTSAADADTLILITMNRTSHHINFLFIPPNTAISNGKMNIPIGIFQQNGANSTLNYVSQLLGIPIQAYIIMDDAEASNFINLLGGVNLYVYRNMTYPLKAPNPIINLPSGYQHLNGSKAVQYLRYRSDDLGAVGRVYRQQMFLKSFLKQSITLKNSYKIYSVLNSCRHNMRSNIDIGDFNNIKTIGLSMYYLNYSFQVLPGTLQNNLWITNPSTVHSLVQTIVHPPKT